MTTSDLGRRAMLGGIAGGIATLASPAWARDRSVAERYRKPTPGSPIDTGGAVIGINAPMDRVTAVVQDYDSYAKMLPRLEDSRIVAKKNGVVDVYMRAPIVGYNKIWLLQRFQPPSRWGNKGKKLIGRYVKGNLDGWHGAWYWHPCGKKRTILRLQMFIDLKFPVPDELVTPELMAAAAKGVTAVRDVAECAP